MWHRAKCIDMWRMYAGEDRDDLSPFAALTRADDLSGLPPAFVRVAELDPLRDEGISYALCLLQAGVAVELHVVPRTFHGFDQVPSALADAAHIEELAVLRRALGANEARTC
jgi:acetyl esterase/lipase